MKTFKQFLKDEAPWDSKTAAAKYVGVNLAGIAMAPLAPPMMDKWLAQNDVLSADIVKKYLEKKKKRIV